MESPADEKRYQLRNVRAQQEKQFVKSSDVCDPKTDFLRCLGVKSYSSYASGEKDEKENRRL